jgi:hypothetical protein
MVFAVYLYVIIATLIAFRLGQPLIRLNFLNERLTANFRYALVRVREYAENIAFYQGAAIERSTLLTLLGVDRQCLGAGLPQPEVRRLQPHRQPGGRGLSLLLQAPRFSAVPSSSVM